MRVIAFDPAIDAAEAAGLGARWMSLADVIAHSDWITLHAPLGPETKHLIGADEIARMKRGVVVVNCARGGIVDEDALADALEAGHVAGVAMDVFENEPPGSSRLFAHPRSVFAPHLGAATVDAQRRVATDVAESIGLALARGEIRDAVNAPR
jgi:D-3-phosphoglycerate dehydrogenase